MCDLFFGRRQIHIYWGSGWVGGFGGYAAANIEEFSPVALRERREKGRMEAIGGHLKPLIRKSQNIWFLAQTVPKKVRGEPRDFERVFSKQL